MNINLTLPFNYQIPEIYLQANPELIATALSLGAEACRILTEEAYTKVRNETHQEIINEVKKTSEQEIRTIRKQREEFDQAYQQATKRIRLLEQDQQQQEQRIRQEERRNREEITREKEARIQALEQQVKDSSKNLTESFHQLKDQLIRNTTGSTNKGRDGESQMEDLLKLAYGSAETFDLTPVGKEGHKGDFMMGFAKAQFLWEVKNYTRMVNKDEVEKLHRDMRENPEVIMGIMVSLQQGITGHTKAGDIDIEFIDNGRCILYISNLHQRQDKVFYLQSLRPFLENMARAAAAKEVETESAELEALQGRTTLILNLLNTHMANAHRHYNSLTNHKKRSEQMFAELQALVRESEGQIKEMIRIAMGTGENIQTQNQALENLQLSEQIFKKTSPLDMNEKERTFVQWLMGEARSANVEEGDISTHSIQLKDLVERGKVAGFSEKEVRGYRETLFQESVWQKGGKMILGLKFI